MGLTGGLAYSFYVVFALGAVAIHALLPHRKRAAPWFGAATGIAALAALLGVLAWRNVVADSTSGFFYLFAGLAVFSAARVVTHTKPVYSALYFVLTVVAVASLLVILQAEFLAVATIIIYAGAILVTYLFVIMLAQQSGAPAYDRNAREPLASVFAGFVLMAAIAGRASETTLDVGKPHHDTLTASVSNLRDLDRPASARGNTADIGWILVTRHVAATELAAVLLLISMVGAIALSRKRIPTEEVEAKSSRLLGVTGREVPPF